MQYIIIFNYLLDKSSYKCYTFNMYNAIAQRKYSQSAKGKVNRARIEVKRDSIRRKTPEYKARRALRDAIKRGKITRGKCHCGEVGQGHHEDYNKPLEVIWLCDNHHKELHNEKVSCIKHPD